MTLAEQVSTDLRDCRLYRFYGWDPRTNYSTKTLIYVGETVRQPLARLLEHVEGKPWADTITGWEVDDQVFAGKAEVLAAEAAAIRRERPLYNYKENLENPHRVEMWRQDEQRWARDDAAGKPRWVKPVETGRRPPARMGIPPRTANRKPASVARSWEPWQVKAVLWSVSWLTASLLTWAGFVRLDWFGMWGWRGQALSACLLVAGVLLRSVTWKRKRRRRRWWR